MKLLKNISIVLVLIPSLSFGNCIDTIPKKLEPISKSINLKVGLKLGNETGPTGKIEYENSHWGKIILHGEIGLYNRSINTLLIDVGLGYGYPIIHINSNSLYFNSHITFNSLGLKETDYIGPSGLFELEYQKTWSNFSLFAAPFFRQQLLYSPHEYEYSHNLSHNLIDYTVGINLGFAFRFPTNK